MSQFFSVKNLSSYMRFPRVVKFIETRRIVATRSWEKGNGDLAFNENRVSVLQDEEFWDGWWR